VSSRAPCAEVARITSCDYILGMLERTREPQNNAKSIDRWDNEGGAPSGGDRTARKRPRDTNLQKKAAAKKSPKRQAQWPGKPAGA
jgi:hypothetical protein